MISARFMGGVWQGDLPICKVLPIAPSPYFDHAVKPADPGKLSTRVKRDIVLQPEIARVFAENFEVYGVRKSLPPRRRGPGGNSGVNTSMSPPARWSG